MKPQTAAALNRAHRLIRLYEHHIDTLTPAQRARALLKLITIATQHVPQRETCAACHDTGTITTGYRQEPTACPDCHG